MAIADQFLDDALLVLDARRAGDQIGIRAFHRLAFVLAVHVASYITRLRFALARLSQQNGSVACRALRHTLQAKGRASPCCSPSRRSHVGTRCSSVKTRDLTGLNPGLTHASRAKMPRRRLPHRGGHSLGWFERSSSAPGARS